ncbi:hypothetical protein IHE45_15G032500 [Dioscorea alata]|uniref:Uncharacterized protein n=1 Tax=Dioscorea alata TaxID=55571 RepID=A0ACB7UKQ4_DIOAL|nr:hypothetical protein IHE45_15G032500 [Dioscorea alata]
MSPLLLSLLLLLLSSEARLLQPQGGEKMMMVMMKKRSMIGSRPPSCEKRSSTCMACKQCEAIQVPVVPQDHKSSTKTTQSLKTVFISGSLERDNSNYKPMNWKCKCGNMIFNP